NDQLRGLLGLEGKSGFRYALKEFNDKLGAVDDEVGKVNQKRKNKEQLDLFENSVLEFHDRMGEFFKTNVLELRVLPPKDGGDEWETLRDRQRPVLSALARAQPVVVDSVLKKHNLTFEAAKKLSDEQGTQLDNEMRAELRAVYERLLGED